MIEDRRRRRATPARVIDGENGVVCWESSKPAFPVFFALHAARGQKVRS